MFSKTSSSIILPGSVSPPQVRESNQRVDLDALMVIVQNAMYFFYKGRLNLPESDCAQEDDGDESRDLLSYVPHMDPRSARLGLLVVGELDRTTEEEQILQDIPWCQRGFILPGEFTRNCKLTHSVLALSDPTEAAEYLNLYSINRQVIDEYSFCAKYHDHSNRVGAPGPRYVHTRTLIYESEANMTICREFKRCFNGDVVLLEEFNARKVDY